MLVVCEKWTGDGDKLLSWPNSTSFSSWLGLLNCGSLRAQSPLSAAGSQFGILSPTDPNRLCPGYITTSRPPASAVLPLIYAGASLDWQFSRGSIYNNHPILIFQNSTCGIFLHVHLHPPLTHILQIMFRTTTAKLQKEIAWTTAKYKILIRRWPSHYVTLAQANYHLNLFYTILCTVGYPNMRASKYNIDASFILPNTIGPSAIPWRISKP